jgi:hypothetical protein
MPETRRHVPGSNSQSLGRTLSPRPRHSDQLPLGARGLCGGSFSSDLQCGQCDHREQKAEDVEAHHDLRLIPALLFKMMVNGSH